MKKTVSILLTICATSVFALMPFSTTSDYDPQYVITSTVDYKNENYKVVYMRRSASGNKIKAKYFAAQGEDGTSVPHRFQNWAKNKNIICYSSGGYMDDSGRPVGINVDNGVVVNHTMKDFDGLLIVYATGGLVATNLDNADLTIQGKGIPTGKKFDIRNSAMDRTTFLNWCETENATVFQTHLLAYKNQIEISSTNSKATLAERRFLAVGKEGNEIIHAIVHCPSKTTLYEGTRRTLEFLNGYKNMNVTFMINLDPGAQNVFFLLDEQGNVDDTIQGTLGLNSAANLLVYYYE